MSFSNTDFQLKLEPAESTLYPFDKLQEFVRLSMNIHPSGKQPQEIIDLYFDSSNNLKLLLATIDDQMFGIIGLELKSEEEIQIRHICVDPDVQWRGLGHLMIDTVSEQYQPRIMTALADDQNVGFFESCDFQSEKIASRYCKNDQFRCTKLIVL